jgi:hypothetical protein
MSLLWEEKLYNSIIKKCKYDHASGIFKTYTNLQIFHKTIIVQPQ